MVPFHAENKGSNGLPLNAYPKAFESSLAEIENLQTIGKIDIDTMKFVAVAYLFIYLNPFFYSSKNSIEHSCMRRSRDCDCTACQ